MPLPEKNISSDLVDFLKDRFEISDSVNEQGQLTDEPSEMKVFSFDYITQKGQDKGCVVISLLDDSESSNSIKIYFGQDLANADSDTRTEWYKFLQQLRQFAKMHLLGFDVRNINKSQISRRDVEKDITLVKEDLLPMFEGSFLPIDGTVKTSHQKLDGEPIKIVIKHTTKVDPSVRGSRSRRINKIYLVNAENERFLLPFKNLIAARAMARHIENGGTPYDNVGRDICQLVEEMVSLNKFYHKQKKSEAASKPYVSSILAAVRERYLDIKKSLASLSSKGGYTKNSPSLTGNAGELENDDDEMMEDIFDGSSMDEESQLALPHVMRAYRNHAKTEEEGEFNNWINAANGQGEGQEILADEEEPYSANDFKNSSVRANELPTTPDQRHTQFISMSGSTESKKNFGKMVESAAQRARGKEAGKRDIRMLRQQKAESEENLPFEYGGMNGSIPTSDEISGEGGQMTFESSIFPERTKKYKYEQCPHEHVRSEYLSIHPNHYYESGTCEDCGASLVMRNEDTDWQINDDILSDEQRALELGEEDYNWTPDLEEGFIKNAGQSIDESLLREFFGFNKESKTREDSLVIEKLLKDLNFELVAKNPDNQIWKKSYFSVIFGPAENKKLGWVITRNGQFKDRGFGSKSFFEAFFIGNPEFHSILKQMQTKNNEKPVTEATLNEFFGLGKKDPAKVREESKKEFASMMELLKFLGFERIDVIDDINTVWKNRYYTIMVVPRWSQKGTFELNWSITRNKKKIAVGVGIVSFGKEILNHDEFRDHKAQFFKIVDDSQKIPVTEADVPSSAAWGSPLTFVSADLPNHYRTSKEIAHHKNTTGKLSPFSLLNRQESDKDANGKDLNRVTDLAGNGRPIQSANAAGVTGKKGNERPSNL